MPESAKKRTLRTPEPGAQSTPRVNRRMTLKIHSARVMRVRLRVNAPIRRAARVKRIVPMAQHVAVPSAAASPRTKRDLAGSRFELFEHVPKLRIPGLSREALAKDQDGLLVFSGLKQRLA